MSVKRRAFSPEFKREAASLVLDQDYSTRKRVNRWALVKRHSGDGQNS